MRGSLDTNILLRLILGELPEQSLAIEKLLAAGGSFVVTDSAIFEMVYVLEKLYSLPRARVVENVQTIIRNEQFICSRILLEQIIDLYLLESKLSIIDCALTRYAESSNSLPLFTFDKALAKACPDSTALPQ